MRQAGIPVEVGLLSREAAQLNEVFIKNMMVEKPFIAAKLAQSLDGRIASRMANPSGLLMKKHGRKVIICAPYMMASS